MARNKYNELKKARKAKMQKLRLQHAMWGTLLVVLSLMIAYVSPALLGEIHAFGDFMGSQATVGGFTANTSIYCCRVYLCASCPHRIA